MAKVAVIGSGISGLTAAHVLSRSHEVHVFESENRLGGHTHTVDVKVESGTYAIDTGFIVFNDWTYPGFIRLLEKIGVPSQKSEMSFSVKSERSGVEWNGADLNRLFVQRTNAFNFKHIQMILEIIRFNKNALSLLISDKPSPTLGEYLSKNKYSQYFCENYIIPMGGAIWSSSVEQMKEFPARFFVEFFKNHGMLSVNNRPIWRVIQGGSRSYIAPLIQPFKDRIHADQPVVEVRRESQQVHIKTVGPSLKNYTFDQVIFACHAPDVLKMLKDPSAKEIEILKPFEYQKNNVTLHTDTQILPKNKNAWASWNSFIPQNNRERVAVTYNMNILQGIRSPETFCVSLNLDSSIDHKKILRKFEYEHPIFTTQTVAAQKRWNEISGPQFNTHYCGAYWRYGFHEDGVQSALKVTESLGETL